MPTKSKLPPGIFSRLGTPVPEKEPLFQTTFWASKEEMAALDRKLQEIRYSGWRKASRAALIRSALKALLTINLEGVQGEEDVEKLLREKLTAR